jgi:cytochrome c peroxidase
MRRDQHLRSVMFGTAAASCGRSARVPIPGRRAGGTHPLAPGSRAARARTTLSKLASLFLAFSVALAGAAMGQSVPTVLDTLDASGVLRTVATNGNSLDTSNPFFQSLGTNGRSCVSCHVPSTGWTISPPELHARFHATRGLDPIFRTNDGSNSPVADVSTLAARRSAYSQLLTKGLIRIGLPILASAEFELVDVDDPYHYASAAELSLFRRPLPTTNLRFITGVMWDGRESFAPLGTLPILITNTSDQNADALFSDLKHQANDATVGHAQAVEPLSEFQREAIVNFELNLSTAQRSTRAAGHLTAHGAEGGPEYLASQLFYVTINDVLNADVETHQFIPDSMTLFAAWRNSRNPARAAIARGAEVFGTHPINITGVGGLNDDLMTPVIHGTCTTCHDTPNVGNHSVALPIDIGLTDPQFRTSDMPLYTLRNRLTGQVRTTSDPGRALLTGRWKDIGKFKGPVLRGLAARAPYFHNGFAADLGAVIDFYNTRFSAGITDQKKADLIAFLNAL